MRLTVLFFALAREITGLSRKQFEFPDQEEMTVLELMDALRKEFPALHFEQDQIKIAVNKTYITDIQYVVKDRDEIALIPPIAGG
mmetsp:Transcript_26690/g.29074  ORF Transcript_26690/g.29074 Transcript_26690/m.29074 type:complete len:85 (+) Transcript_26690:78-332(+)|eukprot:gene13890-15328_t